jgi:hypothetical protein
LRAQELEPEGALAEPPLEASLRAPKPGPRLFGLLLVLRHSEQQRKELPREQQPQARRHESRTARES